MSEFSSIKFEVNAGVAVITLNRPEQLNAISHTMGAELMSALNLADRGSDVRAVILTGSGRAFCAGTDLSLGPEAFAPSMNQGEGNAFVRDTGGVLNLRIFDMMKPVIAAINGPSVGLGATMTLPCDVRLASTSAKFGFVFSRRGIVTEGCSSWFLPRVVGISNALKWTFSGDLIAADEALSAGLVSALYDPDDLLEAAHGLARRLASETSPVAVSMIRKLLWHGLTVSHPMDSHRLESSLLEELTPGPDAREGVESFIAKRPPDFKSRIPDDVPAAWPLWDEPTF